MNGKNNNEDEYLTAGDILKWHDSLHYAETVIINTVAELSVVRKHYTAGMDDDMLSRLTGIIAHLNDLQEDIRAGLRKTDGLIEELAVVKEDGAR